MTQNVDVPPLRSGETEAAPSASSTLDEIQRRVDALAKGIAAKGLPEPEAEFRIESDKGLCVMVSWKAKDRNRYRDYSYFRGSMYVALADADALVAALPSPEQARMEAFMASLSETIELGKHSAIDVEYVNPLLALMKTLSKNALTHQKGA